MLKMNKVFNSQSPEDTLLLAQKIVQDISPGDIIYLYGELGSGKTVFVKGLGKGLGIKEPIVSPSFVIARQYQGDIPLAHIDLYRLSDKDARSLPIEDYILNDGITAIEWADRIRWSRPGFRIRLRIINRNQREIEIEYPEH